MAKYTEEELKEELENSEYKYGFYTDIESDTFPKGLSSTEASRAMETPGVDSRSAGTRTMASQPVNTIGGRRSSAQP